MRLREVEDHAPHRAAHMHANGEECVAKPRDLRAGERGAIGAELKVLKQHVGGRRQCDA